MFWDEENSVSVHVLHEVKMELERSPAIGNECVATFKGKEYTGKIAATGWSIHKSAVVLASSVTVHLFI